MKDYEVWEAVSKNAENKINAGDYSAKQRLRSCTAYKYYFKKEGTSYDIAYEIVVLQSYSTVVALAYIDEEDERISVHDFLRIVYGYTATSAQHIAKFRNEMREKAALKGYSFEYIRHDLAN